MQQEVDLKWNAKSTEEWVRSKIYIISFLCSMLVVWIHTFNLTIYGIDKNTNGLAQLVYRLETFWAEVTQIAVPCFFLVSGFLFFRTFCICNIFQKYKKRIRSIFVPYLCWCTIYWIYYVILSNMPFVKGMLNDSDIVVFSLQSWVECLWTDSYYTLWFLKYLIVLILCSPLIYVVLKEWKHNIPTGGAIVFFFYLNSVFCWISVPSRIEWYILGAWIGINHKQWVFYKNRVISIISIVYICLMFFTNFKLWNNLSQTVFCLAVWFALDVIKNVNDVPEWMRISFFTYVAHDILLESLEKIFFLLLGTNPIYALCDYVFMPIIVFFILFLISKLMKKFLFPVWEVLVGYR